MPNLKIGIVGLGRWGKNLLRVLDGIEEAQVVSVCDAQWTEIDSFRYGTQAYPTIGDMLRADHAQAIVIATPASTHFKLAHQALEQGKHVFVEKPLAMSTYDAGILGAFAEKQVLMVGHTFLYNDLVNWVKEYIDDGEIGRPLYAVGSWLNWGVIRDDVDAFWNFAQHPISILMHWLGCEPHDVHWMGRDKIKPGNADASLVLMKFGPVVAQVALSWLCPIKVRKIILVGEKATITLDDMAREIRIVEGDNTKTKYSDFGQFQLIRRAGRTFIPLVEYREPLANEMQHFVDCCLTGQEPLTGFAHAMAVTKAMEGAVRL